MAEKNDIPPGENQASSLRRALSGEYVFNYPDLFKRSFALFKAEFWTLFQASMVIAAVVLGSVSVLLKFYSLEQLQTIPAELQGIIDIVMILILAPLSTGLTMLGVNAARGEKIKSLQIFNYFPMVLLLALAQLIISLFVQFGIALFIVPGIYVFVASVFTLPLIADKKLSVSQAMLLSAKVVNKYLLHFVALFAIFLVLFLLSAVTFGAALLLVMPFYYSLLGVLYNDLFGAPAVMNGASATKESTFNA